MGFTGLPHFTAPGLRFPVSAVVWSLPPSDEGGGRRSLPEGETRCRLSSANSQRIRFFAPGDFIPPSRSLLPASLMSIHAMGFILSQTALRSE